jgi:hypothetical protein
MPNVSSGIGTETLEEEESPPDETSEAGDGDPDDESKSSAMTPSATEEEKEELRVSSSWSGSDHVPELARGVIGPEDLVAFPLSNSSGSGRGAM